MESVQTQQERDRQTSRQQERERRARDTPEERRRSLRNQRDRERRRARCAARCASALAQLERVCTCIIIRTCIRIYICELAHARSPMSSISLVIWKIEYGKREKKCNNSMEFHSGRSGIGKHVFHFQ